MRYNQNSTAFFKQKITKKRAGIKKGLNGKAPFSVEFLLKGVTDFSDYLSGLFSCPHVFWLAHHF